MSDETVDYVDELWKGVDETAKKIIEARSKKLLFGSDPQLLDPEKTCNNASRALLAEVWRILPNKLKQEEGDWALHPASQEPYILINAQREKPFKLLFEEGVFHFQNLNPHQMFEMQPDSFGKIKYNQPLRRFEVKGSSVHPLEYICTLMSKILYRSHF